MQNYTRDRLNSKQKAINRFTKTRVLFGLYAGVFCHQGIFDLISYLGIRNTTTSETFCLKMWCESTGRFPYWWSAASTRGQHHFDEAVSRVGRVSHNVYCPSQRPAAGEQVVMWGQIIASHFLRRLNDTLQSAAAYHMVLQGGEDGLGDSWGKVQHDWCCTPRADWLIAMLFDPLIHLYPLQEIHLFQRADQKSSSCRKLPLLHNRPEWEQGACPRRSLRFPLPVPQTSQVCVYVVFLPSSPNRKLCFVPYLCDLSLQ